MKWKEQPSCVNIWKMLSPKQSECRSQDQDDADIDDFLREAIETAQLLDQVVPLDGIDIRLLKPRDSSTYQSGQYDRWDDLHEWSQGQRFAGRFAPSLSCSFPISATAAPAVSSLRRWC